MEEKRILRLKFTELLKKQSKEDRLEKSRRILDKLFALKSIQQARTILFYASLPGEVETFAMIKKAIELKKRVALPIVMRNQRTLIPTVTQDMEDLIPGTYGILEPRHDANKAIAQQGLDAVIVPGLAFDKHNNRLGRGAGYYDRFLSDLPKRISTVGLAFDFQIFDGLLPAEAHDVPVQRVIAN